MKKFFTFVLALVAAVTLNAATQVTFDFSDASAFGYTNPEKGQATQVENGAVLSKDGVTITIAFESGNGFRFFAHSSTGVINLRAYVNSSFTIAAPEGKKLSAISADGSNLTSQYLADGMTSGEWTSETGVASLATKVIKSTVQFNTLTITLIDEGEAPPTQETIKATVAEAIAVGQALETGKTTTDVYEVTGFVVNAEAYSTQHNNQIWWMADDAENTGAQEFEAYACTVSENNVQMQVLNGDKVTLTGKITKYNDTKNAKIIIEIKNGTAVFVSKAEGDHSIDGGGTPAADLDTITVAQALEIGKALQVSDKSNKYPSEKTYVIKGYTCAIEAMFDETYKNESFWVSDTKGERTKDNAVAFEVYRGKPNTEKEVGLDALVQFKCQILNFNGTIENYDGNPAVEVLEQGEFHVDTLEASKAYDEALKLDKNATSLDFYAVKGFIHKVKTPYDETYKNATFYISDAMDDTDKDVNCYRATVNAADASKVVEGAYVIVTGHLMHNFYNDKSSAQLTSGVTEFTEAPKVDTIPVTVAEAVAIGLALPIEGKSDGIYAVTGFVNFVSEEFAEGVESFFLADDAESEVFNFYAVNALIAEAAEAGQRIEIVGRLQNADGETVTVDNGKARIIPGEGIENIVLTEKVQKVVVDGMIYIVRDGKMFNLQGAQVR